jgi:hypothetical protein
MMQVNRRPSHSALAYGNRERKPAHGRVREASIRRSFDGVVAGYIRELSTTGDTTSPASQPAGPTPARRSAGRRR